MRILIIRFSSFGDIFQALEAAAHIKRIEPSAAVDWLVRRDFAHLLENQSSVDRVIEFDRSQSAIQLIQKSWQLAPEYERVYDAHSNLRSFIVRLVIRFFWMTHFNDLGKTVSIIKRPKDRIRRLLFFKFRLPVLPRPFRGAESFLRPLRKWYPTLAFRFEQPTWVSNLNTGSENHTGLESVHPEKVLQDFENWSSQGTGAIIAFAPSAAWPNKRWPIDRWKSLTEQWLAANPDARFLLLGGPDDTFLNEISDSLGIKKVFNAVGRSSLLESAKLLSLADALVANDTGLLHVADRLLIPSVAIIGPTAFGYPSSPMAKVAEVELSCKPCSKDGRDACTNAENLKCLKAITPERVATLLSDALSERHR